MTKRKARYMARRVHGDDWEQLEDILIEKYSGRGMFGRTTYAVSMDAKSASEQAKKFGCRTDSLGYDVVCY